MIAKVIEWVMQSPQTRLPILIALIGVLGALIGGFFTVIIWPRVNAGLSYLLNKIIANISGKGFENRYLDSVIKEHQYIPILPTTLVPVTEKQSHELDRLYVSLAVVDSTQKMKDINLNELLGDNSLLVFLGDPGAGKTTMLRFLALTFARARRGLVWQGKANRKREMIKLQSAVNRVRVDFGYKDLPLPIFVYLNRLRNVTEWPSGQSLLDVIQEEWKTNDALRAFPVSFLSEKLSKGECIFLFDAFDELGTQEARSLVARYIGELASSAPRGNRFIVTSRIVGYNGQLSNYGFRAVTVQRLSWDLIVELVKKWYEALNQNELAEQLVNTLKSNPRIYELSTNPMLLSLIVLVQYVRRLIPERRHILYDECVKILVERRYAPPQVQAQYNRILPGAILSPK